MTDSQADLLRGIRVVSLAVNAPGPVAAARLHRLGASVVKVEPPTGDPLAAAAPDWYRALARGQDVVTLNLKETPDRERCEELLAGSDLLLTSSRPAALQRLGLDWPSLHGRHPRLCQLAIIGYPPPDENRAGHDLTYQASAGLLDPPSLPPTLFADMAGAERAVAMAVALLLRRERYGTAGYGAVSLADVVTDLAQPRDFGLCSPGAALGGGLARYSLYRAAEGWIALGALEPHFWDGLLRQLDCDGSRSELERIFLTRTAAEWERWAEERDLPVAAVKEVPLSAASPA
jgi:alpha-methylacyl-CoA racemase